MNKNHTERMQSLESQMMATGYIADTGLLASVDLMITLQKPLLLEGEAGVGKTGIAHSVAQAHEAELIRLQCYEGLDAQHAIYDWDYQRQLLAIQMQQSAQTQAGSNDQAQALKQTIYSDEYLLMRPLLRAIRSEKPVVLLIDEIDRADEEFEALLLEILAEKQITVPELGTFQTIGEPMVILTSNGVRELSDALRRRCLYHYIDYPDRQKELSILRARIPQLEDRLAQQAVSFVQNLRQERLRKVPGIAETLDWVAALCALDVRDLKDALDGETATIGSAPVAPTLPALLKTRIDMETFGQTDELQRILEGRKAEAEDAT